MISALNSVEIKRPVSEVFQFVADPSNEPKWHTDIVRAALEPAGAPGPGKVLKATFRTMGRTSDAVADVSEFEPDRRIVYRFRGRTMGMLPTLTYSFEPVGDRTRFTRVLAVEPYGLMRLLAPLMGGMLRSGNAKFARNLKQRLEATR